MFLLGCLLSLARADVVAGGIPVHRAPGAVITSLDQDKPPCIIERRRLRNRNGTDAVEIELAYPDFMRTTNSAGKPVTHMQAPNTNAWLVGQGVVALPGGFSLEIYHGDEFGRGRAVLLSLRPMPLVPPESPWRDAPFTLTVMEPPPGMVFSPMIQVKGEAGRHLHRISYTLTNGSHHVPRQTAYVRQGRFDLAFWETVGSQFECVDVELLPGTNILSLRAEDDAGIETETNAVYVLRPELDHQPPVLRLAWPQDGHTVTGTNITVRGWVDDCTTRVRARLGTGEEELSVEGVVERDGRFWLEKLPLRERVNIVRLEARDFAGNITLTNLTLFRSETRLVIHPVDERELFQYRLKVTGTVDPPRQRVWVNGREARVEPDGRWAAWPVPVSAGGVAIFDAVAVPLAETESAPALPREVVAVQTRLPAEPVYLNLSRPACGEFDLKLTGTGGRSFVLYSSTNLVEWTPVLTNRNSPDVFQYTERNEGGPGCKFFRVGPVD